MAAKPVETVPDPDEDDLDDLDGSSNLTLSIRPLSSPTDNIIDVLDEFDSKPTLPTEAKPTASGPGRPTPQSTATEVAVEDAAQLPTTATATEEEDLTAQLQAGMANLVSSLGDNPEMQAQFEAMMQELIAAGNADTDEEAVKHVKSASESVPRDPLEEGKSTAGKKEDSFQDTIRKTMERMQLSDTTASASASAKSNTNKSEEEMLMEMLKSLGDGEGGFGGAGGEEDFNTMLLNMMTQLVNKDILYEPMKELDNKFPAWMEKNKDSVKKEDLVRYQEQEKLVREIVQRFERSGYSDENAEDRDFIVERMQKVSTCSCCACLLRTLDWRRGADWCFVW